MALSHWRGLLSLSFSVPKTKKLSSTDLMLKTWKVPGQTLVFSQCWKTGSVGSGVSKQKQQQRRQQGRSVRCQQGNPIQQKTVIFLLPLPFYVGCWQRWHLHSGWVFPHQLRPSGQVFSWGLSPYSDDSHLWQVDIKTSHPMALSFPGPFLYFLSLHPVHSEMKKVLGHIFQPP